MVKGAGGTTQKTWEDAFRLMCIDNIGIFKDRFFVGCINILFGYFNIQDIAAELSICVGYLCNGAIDEI